MNNPESPVNGFSVHRRNIGHWDIFHNGDRVFKLRGGPSHWRVEDERECGTKINPPRFKDQSSAMSYICSELMYETIVVDGQPIHVIEKWNLS